MLLAVAMLIVSIAGRTLLKMTLSHVSGPATIARWAQLSSVIDLISAVACAGLSPGVTVLVARVSHPRGGALCGDADPCDAGVAIPRSPSAQLLADACDGDDIGAGGRDGASVSALHRSGDQRIGAVNGSTWRSHHFDSFNGLVLPRRLADGCHHDPSSQIATDFPSCGTVNRPAQPLIVDCCARTVGGGSRLGGGRKRSGHLALR